MAAKNPISTPRRNKKAASVQPITPAKVEVSQSSNGNLEEEIRRRAYELFLQRGGTPGNENDDWLIAEREVLSRTAAAGHHA